MNLKITEQITAEAEVTVPASMNSNNEASLPSERTSLPFPEIGVDIDDVADLFAGSDQLD